MADEINIKAFDFLQDVTKQIISLASGITGGFIVFNKDIPDFIKFSEIRWGFLLMAISIFFGCSVLLKLTGLLGDRNMTAKKASIYDKLTRFCSFIQISTFVIGITQLVYIVFFKHQ